MIEGFSFNFDCFRKIWIGGFGVGIKGMVLFILSIVFVFWWVDRNGI